MARSLNKVMLIGNLGKDPELRYTSSGSAIATFSLATNESWKDQEGNQQERTEWHNIVAWKKLAEICGEWLKKGKKVYIEGRIPNPELRRQEHGDEAVHHRDRGREHDHAGQPGHRGGRLSAGGDRGAGAGGKGRECLLDAQYFGDMRSFPSHILEGVDAIVHLAGISDDPIGNKFEEVTFDINHRASIDLAKHAKAQGVNPLFSLPAAACTARPMTGPKKKKIR